VLTPAPPAGQKRLTNIAVVRFKTQGLRFEVACYRNTVVAWRNKMCAAAHCRCSSLLLTASASALRSEKDLDNVLQSTTIYSNVSKARGTPASRRL
jgi:ribosome maturation protein SDO1